jgi:hypothetical protein
VKAKQFIEACRLVNVHYNVKQAINSLTEPWEKEGLANMEQIILSPEATPDEKAAAISTITELVYYR